MRKLSLILTGSPVYLNEKKSNEKIKEGGHEDITLDEYTYYEEEESDVDDFYSKDYLRNNNLC